MRIEYYLFLLYGAHSGAGFSVHSASFVTDLRYKLVKKLKFQSMLRKLQLHLTVQKAYGGLYYINMTFFSFFLFGISKLPIEAINIGISIVIHIWIRSIASINSLRLRIDSRNSARWRLSPRVFGLAQIHQIDEKS